MEVEAIATDHHSTAAEKLKAAHALSGLAGSYAKTVEAHDIEARVAALEGKS